MGSDIIIFCLISVIMAGVVASILSNLTPRKTEKPQQRDTLPKLPIIQPVLPQAPGYQQPGNPYPVNPPQPQLDAYTVNYMLQLVANQRRVTDER